MSLLALDRLSLTIGSQPILHEVSLSLAPGEVLGLVGESGSGKSMTALSILRLLPQSARVSGAVTLNGRALLPLSEPEMCRLRGAEVGMIFQEPMTALNPLMSIGDQVAETLMVHARLSRAEALAVARERLDRVGLTAPRFPLSLYPHELSGGQRQRVAIALAIALRPRLLIADEPTTALDVTTQAEVLSLLKDLVKTEGMGLLLITHDLGVTAQMADRVVVMHHGRVEETGATEAIYRRPRAPYTRALIEAATHRPARAVAAPAQEVLLRVENATRTYRLARPRPFAAHPELRAVDGVSFTLAPGESLGLVGESGCGKSTLTRAILGLDPLASGRISLAGHEVSPAMPRAARAAVQVVFQDPYGSFDPRQRVEKLVAEPFHLTGHPPDWRARVAAALTEVGLAPEDGRRFIHQFSGGQRQRLAIARALITRPRLIVLDEAVSALDLRIRAQVLDLLAALQASHGLAYLFITHDLNVVRAITSRCMVMQAGKIVEEGATEALLSAPRHPYTQRLLASAPQIPAAWKEEANAPSLV